MRSYDIASDTLNKPDKNLGNHLVEVPDHLRAFPVLRTITHAQITQILDDSAVTAWTPENREFCTLNCIK